MAPGGSSVAASSAIAPAFDAAPGACAAQPCSAMPTTSARRGPSKRERAPPVTGVIGEGPPVYAKSTERGAAIGPAGTPLFRATRKPGAVRRARATWRIGVMGSLAPPRLALERVRPFVSATLTVCSQCASSSRPLALPRIPGVMAASVIRVFLNGLIASVGVLLGASVQFVASSTGGLVALFGVLALAIAASTVAEMLCQRGRITRAAAASTMQDQPEEMAYYDALTGLPNRHALYTRLHSILKGRRQGD